MNPRMRRLVAIVCIVVLGVAAAMPASADVRPAVLVALPLLFGTIISVPIPQDDAGPLETAPFVSVRSSRAPPAA